MKYLCYSFVHSIIDFDRVVVGVRYVESLAILVKTQTTRLIQHTSIGDVTSGEVT